MAQVLSPLFTDSILKIRSSPSSFPRSGKRWRSLEGNRPGIDQRQRRSYRRGRDVKIAATAEGSAPQGDDYYAILGLLRECFLK